MQQSYLHDFLVDGVGGHDEMKSQEMKHCWQTKISSLMLSLWLQLHIRRPFSLLPHWLKLDVGWICWFKNPYYLCGGLAMSFRVIRHVFSLPQTCSEVLFYYFYDDSNWSMTSLKWKSSRRWMRRKTYQTSIFRFSQIYWKVFFILWIKRNVVKANTYLFRHEGKRHQK